MYNLSERFPEHYKVDESTVGPTSYFVSDVFCTARKESTFPFTAKDARFKAIKSTGTPSPDHYYPKYRKHRILGGKSLQYSTPRVCMVPKKPVEPFSLQSDIHFARTNINYSSSTIKKGSAFKHWFKCREEKMIDATKQLVRQTVNSKSLPQYLIFPGETSKATLKYKGSNWGKYSSERKPLIAKSDSPGPAAYTLDQERVVRERPKPAADDQRRHAPRCPTSYEETQPAFKRDSQEIIETTHYFDGTCDFVYKKISHNKSPAGLWDKAQRFTYKDSENPPPWAYNVGTIECTRKIIKIVPFTSCSPRFKTLKKSDLGPASYSPDYGQIMQRSCGSLPKFRSTLVAPFGSTVPRLALPSPRYSDEEDEPEPPGYLKVTPLLPNVPKKPSMENIKRVDKGLLNEEKEKYKIVGTSLVLRDIADVELPSVDMRDVYKKYKEKKTHRVPVENEGFLSKEADRTSWVISKTTAHDVDWPAIDDVKVQGGALNMEFPVYNKNPRKDKDHSVYYDIHPAYGSSVYKSTHNYRLKTDLEMEKIYEDPDNVKTILKCFMPKEILYA